MARWLCVGLACVGIATSTAPGLSASPNTGTLPTYQAPSLEELRLLLVLGRAAEARARFERHVTPQGAWETNAEARALLARARLATGDADGALALVSAKRGSAGTDPRLALEHVRILITLDRLEEALARLVRDPETAPRLRFASEPEAWLLYARARTRLGPSSIVNSVPGQAGAAPSGTKASTAWPLVALIQARHAAGDPATSSGPPSAPLGRPRGRPRGRIEHARDIEAACSFFLDAAPLHQEAAAAWHMRALAASSRRDTEAAREAFDAARRARDWNALLDARQQQVLAAPDDPLPRLGLALVWHEAEAFERARELLVDLVTRHPSHARGWFHLAEAERALGRDPLAAYERSLALAPEDADARLRHATALLDTDTWSSPQALARGAEPPRRSESTTQDIERGVRELERLTEGPAGDDPRMREAHWLLAVLLAEQDSERARGHAERYRALGGRRELP